MKYCFENYLFFFCTLIVLEQIVISNGLSVESTHTLKTRRQADKQNGECKRPNQPVNGNYIDLLNTTTDSETFPKNTVLSYSCNKGYTLSRSHKFIVCVKGSWDAEQPTCLKRCPSLHSTTSTIVKCYDENKVEIECDQATDGSEAKFRCANFYEPNEIKIVPRYCRDGTWNLPLLQCVPVCGQKNPNSSGNKVVEYPWVAAIFMKKNNEFINICIGTLLSEKIIITAAHCLANFEGEALKPEIFKVGVGKYYNKYQDVRDLYAQYSDVQNVIVHRRFRGDSQRYSSDIGFLITKDTFQLSIAVQPVCFRNVKNIHLTNQSRGIISGWGFPSKNGGMSDELEEIEIVYKDEATCFSELPREFLDKYYGYDKFCAGFYDNGTSACPRPSGKGLVFKNPQDKKFYIHGILSLGPTLSTNTCGTSTTSLYTEISTHYEMLEQIVSQYN
ncbi:clotting factor G beta subunit-like [Leptinotarsa decemlineata]|uniref:clotting factor G beta subunit-like n=1 Tax=Leptinotarsa decemlineata TaxID=7539 RepID=UPI003D30D3F9